MTASIADIAGIIQGIGSLAAVGVAVWIYAKQHQHKKADDKAEVRAFVQSLHTELNMVWSGYSQNFRPIFKTDIEKSGFIYHAFPINAEALMVYNNTVAKVGKIDDDDFRELIVQTYARTRGLIYSMQFNNGLVNELKQFEIFYNGPDKEARLEQLRTVLRDYASQLLQRDQAIEERMTKLIPMIKQWLVSHPAR